MSLALKSFPFGSASAQAAALRRGQVSSVELLKAHLERVDRFNPALNVLAQYVKDLSFESPGAPNSLRGRAAPAPRARGAGA